MSKVIVGQTAPDRHAADRSAVERPHPAGRRAGSGQDAGDHDARKGRRRRFRPHPVHARPAAGRPDRYADLLAEERGVHRAQRPRLRQLRTGRRDQPLAGEGAVGAARSDAGAPGDHRRRHLQAARALPGAGHAEPPRAGGNLPAARGAGRPIHAQGQNLLPHEAGGARHRADEPLGRRASLAAQGDRTRRHRQGAPRGGGRLHGREDREIHRRHHLRHARTGRIQPPEARRR